jgi:hypothetical protein
VSWLPKLFHVSICHPFSPSKADVCLFSLSSGLINTRLKPSEVAYILDHSASSIILVDHEYTHLLPPTLKVRVIVSNDTGRSGDPYEEFLSSGRAYSQERGWAGFEYNPDENAPATLCYTYAFNDSTSFYSILRLSHDQLWYYGKGNIPGCQKKMSFLSSFSPRE